MLQEGFCGKYEPARASSLVIRLPSDECSRILTGHHLGGNRDAQDVADDCVDTDVVCNARLEVRDGDAAPVPGHPLLELGAPRPHRLIRDDVLCGCPGAVPRQLDGAVADSRHSQVFGRSH